MRSRLTGIALLACAVVGLTACGGEEAAPASPSNVWTLNGNGRAQAGGASLRFAGSVRLARSAAAFDGVTGFGRTAGRGPVDTKRSFSVAAWVGLDRVPELATAVSQLGEVAGAFEVGYAEGAWGFAMASADTSRPGGAVRAHAVPDTPALRTWVHLAGVYDSLEHEIRLYVDGDLAARAKLASSWQAKGPLTVGRGQAQAAPAGFWPGAIGDLRLYAVALDGAQVEELERSTRPAGPPPLAPKPPPGFHCPPAGGACRGPLPVGTHTSRIFSPPVTYTVPAGWTNEEDLLGNFLLRPKGDPRSVGIYRNVAAPRKGCNERPDPKVGRSILSLARWLASHPGLETTTPEPVEVGGLEGVSLDISMNPSWTTCSSGSVPAVPFIVGGDPSSLTHAILPFSRERLYLLEYGDGNVAIEVNPESGSLSQFLEEAGPLVESLRFRR